MFIPVAKVPEHTHDPSHMLPRFPDRALGRRDCYRIGMNTLQKPTLEGPAHRGSVLVNATELSIKARARLGKLAPAPSLHDQTQCCQSAPVLLRLQFNAAEQNPVTAESAIAAKRCHSRTLVLLRALLHSEPDLNITSHNRRLGTAKKRHVCSLVFTLHCA